MLSALVLFVPLAALSLDDSDGRHSSVARAGDVDADGIPDLLVADWGEGLQTVWVLSGRDGNVLQRFVGDRSGLNYGCSLDAALDVDRDGHADVLIGTSRGPEGAGGRVELRSGRDGHVLFTFRSSPDAADGFGFAVAGGGDLDGDGTPDIVVGAPAPREGVGGRVHAYSGADGTLLHVIDGPLGEPAVGRVGKMEGFHCEFRLGTSVEILGDLDGDGCAEFAAGDPGWLADETRWLCGRIDLYSGRTGELVCSIEPDARNDDSWALGLGWTVGAAGDVDADGVIDLYASAMNSYVRVLSGATFEVLFHQSYVGGYKHSEGASMDAVGDLDGDGFDDVVHGSNETWDVGNPDSGRATAVSGRTGKPLFVYESRIGRRPFDGIDVAGLGGDVNGDGTPDLVVKERERRRILVLSGRDGMPVFSVDQVDLRSFDSARRR